MKVSELGEVGLIQRLDRQVAERSPGGREPFPLVLGIGDDTAAWRTEQGTELWTTDTLVDGVHFTLLTASPEELGWKALAVNLSDIAAMGGSPLYALVTLGLPGDTEVEWVDVLYQGLLECSGSCGGRIVGGDLVRSPVTFITVGVTGLARRQPLLRSAARVGEQVAVTGALGASGAGLAALHRGTTLGPEVAQALRQAHLRPQPRIAEGQRLAAAGVRCAMDISDGLVADLSKLCLASGVAARLQAAQVPIHPAARQAFPEECLDMALGGGEEYELLFTAPAETMKGLMAQLPQGAAVVGDVVEGPPGQVTVLGADGQEMDVRTGGWDHFQSGLFQS